MGCDRRQSDRLVVATSWPRADRDRISAAFADWLAAEDPGRPVAAGITWLILEPGDDPARLAERRDPPDVLLGAPAASCDRLARSDGLAPLPMYDSDFWVVVRRARIRLTGPSSGPATPRSPTPDDPGNITFDDPRDDPISLAWARSLLADGHFREGYARLVRAAGHPRRIGRLSGSARAAVDRGEAGLAPSLVTESLADVATGPDLWLEGAAIPRNARNRYHAGRFLQFLVGTGRARVGHGSESSIGSDDLLAELLGATLVDAQDELWSAWSALKAAGNPENALRWMTEPPPWPPASVAKMIADRGDRGMEMMETLAGELAAEPAVRAWLIRSWLSPGRLVDEKMLGELTLAAEGRLLREPGFRDWLRAEWTVWARQRYRRVARLASAGSRQPAAGSGR
jgi:hypothetical protein